MPRTAKHLKKHQFKPGQSGNPKGYPGLDPETKKLKKLNAKSYRKVIKIALTGNYDDLVRFAEDTSNSAVEIGVARLLIRAINKGDSATFDHFVSRIVGKIPDKIEFEGSVKSEKTLNIKVESAKQIIDAIRQKVLTGEK